MIPHLLVPSLFAVVLGAQDISICSGQKCITSQDNDADPSSLVQIRSHSKAGGARELETPKSVEVLGHIFKDSVDPSVSPREIIKIFRRFEKLVGVLLFDAKTFLDADLCGQASLSDNTVDPVQYWSVVTDDALGNTTYPTKQLPSLSNLDARLITYNCHQFLSFFVRYQVPMLGRLGDFSAYMAALQEQQPTLKASALFASMEDYLNRHVVETSPVPTTPFLQGSNDKWKSDAFAGQYIGYAFTAVFLQQISKTSFVLDLSGEQSDSYSQVVQFVEKAVTLAPQNMLRARGYIQDSEAGPVLMRVEIKQEDATQPWLSFSAETSTPIQWEYAKAALVSLALFTEEVFHTGMHLFAGTTITAASRGISASTALRDAIAPSAQLVVFALLEQTSVLHTNHSSVFSGSVWDTDIVELWQLTSAITQFFYNNEPEDILGMADADNDRPDWWAGMSASFIDPISIFAGEVASSLTGDDAEETSLTEFANQLEFIGGYEGSSATEDLGPLLRNLLFIPGVCHTHMYATRELMTPLAGWPDTVQMLPVLLGETSEFDPVATSNQYTLFHVAFATAGGFDQGVPQLGSGPWEGMVKKIPALSKAVKRFQASLEVTRESVLQRYSTLSQDGFLPSYYFPNNVSKPFGFSITQTTYV